MILQNRSSHLHLLSRDAHIDFLNPSERCSLQNTFQAESVPDSSNLEDTDYFSSGELDLWLMFVRMISFILVKSRYAKQCFCLLSYDTISLSSLFPSIYFIFPLYVDLVLDIFYRICSFSINFTSSLLLNCMKIAFWG